MATTRNMHEERYALALETGSAGMPSSVDGGYPSGNVVVDRPGPDMVRHKHLAGIKYEDITINCGTGMSRELYDWIGGTLTGRPIRKTGTIDTLDTENRPISRLQFTRALVTEVELPAVDAASREPATLTVTITPESTAIQREGLGTAVHTGVSRNVCLQSNFRLQLGDLDCSRVNKIEAIHVTSIATDRVGPEVSNISISMAESSASGFYAWFDDFVIKGLNGRDKLKNGNVQLLSADLHDALFTFELRNVGIFRVAPERSADSTETISRVRVDMYFEQMGFAFANAAVM
jgi:T4-like virus tail tube protein gp19